MKLLILFLILVFVCPKGWADQSGTGNKSALDSIDKGIRFLQTHQNKDGSWGSAKNTKDLNIYTPVQGGHMSFKTAVTAMCLDALLKAQAHSLAVSGNTIEMGTKWLLGNLHAVRRSAPEVLYNVWTHAFVVQALLEMKKSDGFDKRQKEEMDAHIKRQIALLERFESVTGGWGYLNLEYPTQKPNSGATSFTTATVLIILHDAMESGYAVNGKTISRALAIVRRQQNPDHTYAYSVKHFWRPAYKSNLSGGSLGRTHVCNLALSTYGDQSCTPAVRKIWLDKFLERHGWLDMARKRPIPHESWFDVAGYYYYYGHYYASMTVSQLPMPEKKLYANRLAQLLSERQEKDGSWWDFPLYDYHKYYGTSFALMSLLHHIKE